MPTDFIFKNIMIVGCTHHVYVYPPFERGFDVMKGIIIIISESSLRYYQFLHNGGIWVVMDPLHIFFKPEQFKIKMLFIGFGAKGGGARGA